MPTTGAVLIRVSCCCRECVSFWSDTIFLKSHKLKSSVQCIAWSPRFMVHGTKKPDRFGSGCLEGTGFGDSGAYLEAFLVDLAAGLGVSAGLAISASLALAAGLALAVFTTLAATVAAGDET